MLEEILNSGVEKYAEPLRKNAAAWAGLLSRGRAIQLSEGTRVSTLASDGSMVKVMVESGSHSGQQCWLPMGALRN